MDTSKFLYVLYAENDYESIDNIFLEMFKAGIPIKAEKDIDKNDPDVLEHTVQSCTAIMLVLSREFFAAKDFHRYLMLADQYNKHIIPYYLEDPAEEGFTIPTSLYANMNGSAAIPAYEYALEDELVKRVIDELREYFPEEVPEEPVKSKRSPWPFIACGAILCLSLILLLLLTRDKPEPKVPVSTAPPVSVATSIPESTEASSEEPSEEVQLSQADILTNVSNATVQIFSIVSRRDYSTGSGFLINDQGWIATNYHVIDDGKTFYAKPFTDRDTDATYNITILSVDKEHDLAIVKIDSDYAIQSYLPINTDGIRTGETVYVSGYPKGIDHTITNGIISNAAHTSNDGSLFFMLTAPISSGNSGGPVINEKGEVIGVASAKYESAENLNLARPASFLKELIENTQE